MINPETAQMVTTLILLNQVAAGHALAPVVHAALWTRIRERLYVWAAQVKQWVSVGCNLPTLNVLKVYYTCMKKKVLQTKGEWLLYTSQVRIRMVSCIDVRQYSGLILFNVYVNA